MIWYSHLFKDFPQFVVIHVVKGFNTVNETEVVLFFFFNSLAFSMIQRMLAICFSKSSVNTLKLLVLILLKSSLKEFEHNFASYSMKVRASLMAQMIQNPPAMQETQVLTKAGEIPWRRDYLSTPVFLPGESHA